MTRVKVTVLSDASARSLVQALVSAFAAAGGIPADDERRLEKVVAGLVDFTLDQRLSRGRPGEIQVKLEADADLVHVTVHDWGLPLLSAGGVFRATPGGAGRDRAGRAERPALEPRFRREAPRGGCPRALERR